MATVQLTDIIDVEVFQDLESVNNPETSAFVQSGIIARSPLFDELASGPGLFASMPFWNDIDPDDEPNMSDDDPSNSASAEKVSQDEQITRKAYLNKGLSESDLASELVAGTNAIQHIRNRVDAYWTRQFQRRVISTALGIYADNVANDSSDMVFDIAGTTNGDVTASTVFTRSNFTSSAYTLGDAVQSLGVMAVHSVVMKRMVDAGDVEDVKDSEGNIVEQRYLGHTIVMDDSMPFTPAAGSAAGDAAPRYTSIIFGSGAMGWGNGTPAHPVSTQREEDQANGGGVETLWTRKTWLIHPLGYKVTATPAAKSFTRAELAAAATWDRIVPRKNVPVAFLITNG